MTIDTIADTTGHCRASTLEAKPLVVEIGPRWIHALSREDAGEVHVHDLENRAESHYVPRKGEAEELGQCRGDLELGVRAA